MTLEVYQKSTPRASSQECTRALLHNPSRYPQGLIFSLDFLSLYFSKPVIINDPTEMFGFFVISGFRHDPYTIFSTEK